jgi:hypothetical protein
MAIYEYVPLIPDAEIIEDIEETRRGELVGPFN